MRLSTSTCSARPYTSSNHISRIAVLMVALTFVVQLFVTPTNAFAAPSNKKMSGTKGGGVAKVSLPTFNKKTQKWEPPANPEVGYGLTGTLLRNGPVPFFTRLTNPEDYDQAVMKFQATEQCPRDEAQGNMDAYFENPNDWAYQRVVEQNGGYKKKYGAPLDTKQIVLTVTWGVGLVYIISNIAIDVVRASLSLSYFYYGLTWSSPLPVHAI
jgi:hypothetical protein